MDEIVRKAKEHLFAAVSLPYPEGLTLTAQWQAQRDKNRQAILKMSTVEEAVMWAQSMGDSGFNHRGVGNAESLKRQMEAFSERWPGALDHHEAWESPLSRLETLAWVDGRVVSNIWFWHMEALLRSTALEPKPWRVVEIGGGLGELARLATKSISFMWQVIDIPESLFFTEVFLRANGVTVDYQRANRAKVDYEIGKAVMSAATVWLLPLQSASRFLTGDGTAQKCHVDAIVSQGSLQEMTPEAVGWWWDKIMNSTAKHFLSINGKAATNIPWRSEEWEVLHQEHDTPSLRAVLDSGADFEELVLRRKTTRG